MIDKERYKIINGDSFKVLDTLQENSIDACITDPPYGLTTITKRFGKKDSKPTQFGKDGSFARLTKGFMGKEWDGSGIEQNVEFWEKVYKVLKPGSYLLAFGGTRTFHRIACAIEDAGFEIRDTIMWLYGSGFPKSHNIGLDIDKKQGCSDRGHRIATANRNHPDGTLEPNGENLPKYEGRTELGKKWQGWGPALKPAYEPIIVARQPIEKTVADNVLKYGTGGINIDECRVGNDVIKGGTMPDLDYVGKEQIKIGNGHKLSFGQIENAPRIPYDDHVGRFPANVILTYDETDFDEVCGNMPNTNEESVCRYFYCAKASKKDRDSGLILFEEKQTTDGCLRTNSESARTFGANSALRKNIHPTVKPVDLMQYLIRLVTPRGGVIIDPFNGSGSTGKAVAFENRERDADYKYIGIELDKEYCAISESRIDYAINKFQYDILEEIAENEKYGQLSLFGDNNE